uniref:Uncharacterized protein n=1 Tax=Meloidogyne enterolobii TaxID=390850 RepID=A0A6V7UWT5_MELEN|nr:unnamed protein product [Meloidogyne enterolobii]
MTANFLVWGKLIDGIVNSKNWEMEDNRQLINVIGDFIILLWKN